MSSQMMMLAAHCTSAHSEQGEIFWNLGWAGREERAEWSEPTLRTCSKVAFTVLVVAARHPCCLRMGSLSLITVKITRARPFNLQHNDHQMSDFRAPSECLHSFEACALLPNLRERPRRSQPSMKQLAWALICSSTETVLLLGV